MIARRPPADPRGWHEEDPSQQLPTMWLTQPPRAPEPATVVISAPPPPPTATRAPVAALVRTALVWSLLGVGIGALFSLV